MVKWCGNGTSDEGLSPTAKNREPATVSAQEPETLAGDVSVNGSTESN